MAGPFDVVVVGAGPAGSVAAREAARLGCGSVLLLEQHEFPRQKVCAGGLSRCTCAILKELGLWAEVAREAYPIRVLRLVVPNGKELILPTVGDAFVMNRALLDQMLVDAAVEEGVQFRPGTKVEGLLEEDGRVVGVRCGTEEIAAGWVIVATGSIGRFRARAPSTHLIHSCMAWFEGPCFTSHVAEITYDPELLPRYGWLFPESESRANFGACLQASRRRGRSIRDVFARFLERHYGDRLARVTQLGVWRGHPIATAASVRHRAPPGLLLVGEANRLVNVATGEGILCAIISGRLAARALRAGRDKGLDAPGTARLYASALRRSLALRFRIGSLYHKINIPALNALSLLPRREFFGRFVAEALTWL